MWRRLLAVAGWALPQPSANLNPMPSVARLSRACAVRPGCPAQLGVMCSPSQRWAAWWLRCCRPHRVGRLFGLTRRALPRRRHLAAPSLTPFTHFGGWRRFPALRAVDHCARLLLCSMGRAMCWAGQGANPARSYVGFTSSSFLPTRLDNRSPAWPSSMPAHTAPTGRFAEHPPPAPPSTHHVPRFSQRRRPTHHPQFLRSLPW